MIARKLATVERVLCASPAFLAKHGKLTTVASLARVPCLVQGPPPTRWTFDPPDGPTAVDVDGCMRSSNVIALRDATQRSLALVSLGSQPGSSPTILPRNDSCASFPQSRCQSSKSTACFTLARRARLPSMQCSTSYGPSCRVDPRWSAADVSPMQTNAPKVARRISKRKKLQLLVAFFAQRAGAIDCAQVWLPFG